jgi:hypothetical protein
LLDINPFYQLLELVRQPLLWRVPTYMVALFLSVVNLALAGAIFVRFPFAYRLLGLTRRLGMSTAHVELVLENVSIRFPVYSGSSQSVKKQLLFCSMDGGEARSRLA